MFTPSRKCVSSLMCQHGMGNKRHWRHFSFNIAHILYVENVSGIILCTCSLYFETCCKWRFVWALYKRSSPFHIWYVFLWREGVWELDVPLVVCPLMQFICVLGHGSFHFVLCFPPFFGVLIFYGWQGVIILVWT